MKNPLNSNLYLFKLIHRLIHRMVIGDMDSSMRPLKHLKEQKIKPTDIALKEAISDRSKSDISDEDDQWAFALIKVYRAILTSNSKLSPSKSERSK